MKKHLLIGIAIGIGSCAVAQIPLTSQIIGTTDYQKQSFGSIGNRIVNHPDGTISAAWNLSETATPFADLGTGYNYMGTSWGAAPTVRVENARTAYPNIGITGSGAEIIVTAESSTSGAVTGIHIARRAAKDGGPWTDTTLSTVNDVYPHFVVGGANKNTLHIIARTETAYMGQNGGAITYSRSRDGGATWDKIRTVIPEIDFNSYYGFSPDGYSIDAKGDTVVIVTGGFANDVVVLKSINNGNTWAKTVIDSFPIRLYNPTAMTTDTTGDGVGEELESNDCSLNVLIDHDGYAHVFYGKARIIGELPNTNLQINESNSDGLYYWTDKRASTPPTMIAKVKDYNNDGIINMYYSPSVLGSGSFQASLTSFPSAGIDAQGRIFLTYSSVFEGLNDNQQGYNVATGVLIEPVSFGKSFRHQYVMRSDDDGLTWFNSVDITQPNYSNPSYNGHEGVFGAMAKRVDNYIHIIAQDDGTAGHGVLVPEDAGNLTANIIYYKIPVSSTDVDASVDENSTISNIGLFPNPATNAVNLTLNSLVNTKADIKVYNMVGQSISTVQKNIMKGSNTLQLDISKLTSGVYFVSAILDGKIYSQKLIVK